MVIVAIVSAALIALTTLLHYEALRGLTTLLPLIRIPPRPKLLVVMFVAFFAHGLENALYGLALFVLVHWLGMGSLAGSGGASLVNCLYFSAEVYTSLGLGDLLPSGPVRLLAGVEALNGLLLIGWTASYLYIAMERFWNGGLKQ
jgi:hypothetical protein